MVRDSGNISGATWPLRRGCFATSLLPPRRPTTWRDRPPREAVRRARTGRTGVSPTGPGRSSPGPGCGWDGVDHPARDLQGSGEGDPHVPHGLGNGVAIDGHEPPGRVDDYAGTIDSAARPRPRPCRACRSSPAPGTAPGVAPRVAMTRRSGPPRPRAAAARPSGQAAARPEAGASSRSAALGREPAPVHAHDLQPAGAGLVHGQEAHRRALRSPRPSSAASRSSRRSPAGHPTP
jgi:hypothetical protein